MYNSYQARFFVKGNIFFFSYKTMHKHEKLLYIANFYFAYRSDKENHIFCPKTGIHLCTEKVDRSGRHIIGNLWYFRMVHCVSPFYFYYTFCLHPFLWTECLFNLWHKALASYLGTKIRWRQKVPVVDSVCRSTTCDWLLLPLSKSTLYYDDSRQVAKMVTHFWTL